jgi:hypothetical protein
LEKALRRQIRAVSSSESEGMLRRYERNGRTPFERREVMGRLEKKVALVTGAANEMGRATAVRFAGAGAAIVISEGMNYSA